MIAARLSPATVAASGRHSGRWAFGPTPRTVLLLAVGLALAIPGWVDSRALVLMAAWDVFVLALAALDLRRLPLAEQLRVTRTWHDPLSIGRPASVGLTVENQGSSERRWWESNPRWRICNPLP